MMKRASAVTAAAVVLFSSAAAAQESPALGPRDGRGLEPVDTGRVGTGDMAPDFALRALDGSIITLSQYRGEKNVILVFYRGYW